MMTKKQMMKQKSIIIFILFSIICIKTHDLFLTIIRNLSQSHRFQKLQNKKVKHLVKQLCASQKQVLIKLIEKKNATKGIFNWHLFPCLM